MSEIRVRLGLDKTGFDSGLKGAGATVKKFMSFFGLATSAVFLKRIIGDVGSLAQEVATLRNESLSARDAFDRMAGGIEHVGDVAGVTTEQLEKMRRAAKMFTPEDLDGLAKGASLWSKIKESTAQVVGKGAAFAVNAGAAFFGLGSSLIAGGEEEAAYHGRLVASDRAVGKALRDERERERLLEEQNKEIESRLAMFLEEDVYIQKMVEAEQTRLAVERELLRVKIAVLEADQKSANLKLRDRSGFTLAELTALESGGPGALKAHQAALKIEQLEEQARTARLEEFGAGPLTERQKMEAARRTARGIAGPLSADELTEQAVRLRGALEPLVSGERNPIGELESIKKELATLRELATGTGLQVQPRMAK